MLEYCLYERDLAATNDCSDFLELCWADGRFGLNPLHAAKTQRDANAMPKMIQPGFIAAPRAFEQRARFAARTRCVSAGCVQYYCPSSIIRAFTEVGCERFPKGDRESHVETA